VSRPALRRVQQITDWHCGPAVMQMLLAHAGVAVSQEDVAIAGEAKDRIEKHGMRIDQLARAAARLAPETRFWSKERSDIADLVALVNRYGFPVGVEWQGVFEGEETDCGHYSVVAEIDERRSELFIVDPYQGYDDARVFPLSTFEERWWDTNEVLDPLTGEEQLAEDFHMMFVVAPAGDDAPAAVGMTIFPPPRP
jgi:ABC-type bacteriocin/lantibiotic exporter with double-glycine peptidase domain